MSPVNEDVAAVAKKMESILDHNLWPGFDKFKLVQVRADPPAAVPPRSTSAASPPRRNWPPREAGPVRTSAPIASAMRAGSSDDPPSVTITSRISPAFSPSIRAATQPGRAVAAFSVGMMTEIGARMGFVGRVRCYI